MSGFQIAAIALLGLVFAGTLAVTLRGLVSRLVGAVWATIWLVAAGAIIWPDSTSVFARVLGIGRGADLVLYCFVLIVLIGFYMTYVRLRRIDSSLTRLVRHLAIEEALARSSDKPSPQDDPNGVPSPGEEN